MRPSCTGQGQHPVYAPLLRWARAATQSMCPSCAGQGQQPSLCAPPALGKGSNPVYASLLHWARAAPSLCAPPVLGKGSNPVYAPLLCWARAATQSTRPSCAGQGQHPVYVPLLRWARAAPGLRAPPALSPRIRNMRYMCHLLQTHHQTDPPGKRLKSRQDAGGQKVNTGTSLLAAGEQEKFHRLLYDTPGRYDELFSDAGLLAFNKG